MSVRNFIDESSSFFKGEQFDKAEQLDKAEQQLKQAWQEIIGEARRDKSDDFLRKMKCSFIS